MSRAPRNQKTAPTLPRRLDLTVRREKEIKELARMVHAELKGWDCDAAWETALRRAGYHDGLEPYGA